MKAQARAAAVGRHKGRRHNPAGGYARGARTRRKIIETAIDMFGEFGYESTSTRAIARRAAVSLPALQYYFGGKAGLHRACGEYITADVRAQLTPAAARVQQALTAPDLSRAELLRLLRMVIEPFLEGMATDRPESWVLFFTRAQSGDTPATDVIFDHVAARMIGLCSTIIARVLDLDARNPEVLIRTVSVIGQIATVRRGRPLVLRALGWPDFSGKRLRVLKEVLWKQIEASLS
jgi:AcrR family transcriptional regulator